MILEINLTKKERNLVYQKLLVKAEEHVESMRRNYLDGQIRGLCWIIYEITNWYPVISYKLKVFEHDFLWIVSFENTFPELLVQTEMLQFDTNELFWFSTNIKGWMQRIQLINNAIKATE